MRMLKTVALALGVLVLSFQAQAAEDFLAGIPRNEVLIAENPEGTVTNPGNFNLWISRPNGTSTGLQQLAADTLWYIDADHGLILKDLVAPGDQVIAAHGGRGGKGNAAFKTSTNRAPRCTAGTPRT